MTRRLDDKLRRLDALVGRGWLAGDLRELGRLGDLTTVADGEVLQREGEGRRWAFWVVDGSLGLSHDGEPIAVAGPGSFVPAARPSAAPASATAVALGDLEVVTFRARDLRDTTRSRSAVGRWLAAALAS